MKLTMANYNRVVESSRNAPMTKVREFEVFPYDVATTSFSRDDAKSLSHEEQPSLPRSMGCVPMSAKAIVMGKKKKKRTGEGSTKGRMKGSIGGPKGPVVQQIFIVVCGGDGGGGGVARHDGADVLLPHALSNNNNNSNNNNSSDSSCSDSGSTNSCYCSDSCGGSCGGAWFELVHYNSSDRWLIWTCKRDEDDGMGVCDLERGDRVTRLATLYDEHQRPSDDDLEEVIRKAYLESHNGRAST
eukprot:TRINITY_DN735_c0_g1_i1.p1 TRINITY_DN735_c0_g1~~TRINITY_DN735_c0_g1_i1.p1  ORF type:complete len:243 (+),score=79.30 TRINITY_DN735_c0_g1_i1:499-1227(+)